MRNLEEQVRNRKLKMENKFLETKRSDALTYNDGKSYGKILESATKVTLMSTYRDIYSMTYLILNNNISVKRGMYNNYIIVFNTLYFT